MCDIQGHPQDPVLDKLQHMDEKLDGIAEEQAQLKYAVFGKGTTKGLVTKVDELREVPMQTKRAAGGISAVVSALIAALMLVVGRYTGLDVQQ